MESILHLQPMVRAVLKPLTIGHKEYISLGEKTFEGEEDPLGEHASQLRVGSPLEENVDYGSKRSHIPLLKTLQFSTDSENGGHVFLETVHYIQDEKYLVPLRSKIMSGRSKGIRIAHLPSLNHIRWDICGPTPSVSETRSFIVEELLDHDSGFEQLRKYPIMDWLRDEFVSHLSTSNVTDVDFDARRLELVAHRFRNQVCDLPFDLSPRILKTLGRALSLEHECYPTAYYSNKAIGHSIKDLTRFIIPPEAPFENDGPIETNAIPGLIYHPASFSAVANLIDNIPLSSFNVDVILSVDNEIVFYHEHQAQTWTSRYYKGIKDIGGEDLLSPLVNDMCIAEILKLFVMSHEYVRNNADVFEYLSTRAVKMKLIKTSEDEAVILLYRYNSSSTEDPLCGVYFDLALLSLAPLTTLENPILS